MLVESHKHCLKRQATTGYPPIAARVTEEGIPIIMHDRSHMMIDPPISERRASDAFTDQDDLACTRLREAQREVSSKTHEG